VVGEKYNMLTYLCDLPSKNGQKMWLCCCECGTYKGIAKSSVTRGSAKSCGCYKASLSRKRMHDITGIRFGNLTVIKYDKSIDGKTYWLCKCVCGNVKSIKANSLKSMKRAMSRGQISCGCMSRGFKHGFSSMPEYRSWSGMVERCRNKNQKYYGADGIEVYPPWSDPISGFKSFLDYIGNRPSKSHSIDRIDSRRGYFPGNVRWATSYEQARNKANTRLLEYGGKTMCVADWATAMRVGRQKVHYHCVKMGMSIGDFAKRFGLDINIC
jgi:hypothetical protein